jgi:DNA polymerase-3 subunit delta'
MSADIDSTWDAVIGQPDAIRRLQHAALAPVHAYLFLGNPGVGTARAARAFAAMLLTRGLDPVAVDRSRRLALAGSHPDLAEIRPEGAALRVVDAKEIIRHGQTSPVEGAQKIIVVHGIDAIEEAAIGRLLKVIEEPPASSIFVLLAEHIPPELVTIASRCVVIEFAPIPVKILEVALVAAGTPIARAKLAAAAAGGDLDRAELLAGDDQLAARAALWAGLPERLDGTGSLVVELTRQLRERMDDAQATLEVRHGEEMAELDARAERLGERGLGRAELVARHKRQIRALRTDELRFGFATLSRQYRDRLIEDGDPRVIACIDAVQRASESLVRNPNEALLLQSLLLQLR